MLEECHERGRLCLVEQRWYLTQGTLHTVQGIVMAAHRR